MHYFWVFFILIILVLIIALVAARDSTSKLIKKFFASNLSGDQEVPKVNTVASGHAAIKVWIFKNKLKLHYEIKVSNLSSSFAPAPGHAHFHFGAPGENGPVVKTLVLPKKIHVKNMGPTWLLRGSWTSNDEEPLTPKLMQDLIDGNLYINIHTQRYPAGEIRGQVGHATRR